MHRIGVLSILLVLNVLAIVLVESGDTHRTKRAASDDSLASEMSPEEAYDYTMKAKRRYDRPYYGRKRSGVAKRLLMAKRYLANDDFYSPELEMNKAKRRYDRPYYGRRRRSVEEME